jgi:succinate dehydrogenase / fumarate reductase membrane anchor subunit
MNNNLTTNLTKVKGTTFAKTNSSHWLYQRITAVILIICSIWLVLFINYAAGKNLSYFVSIIQKPYNIVPLVILLIASFYHAMLGMRVLIEDYISCIKLRNLLIISLQIFCLTTTAFCLVALFYTMIN